MQFFIPQEQYVHPEDKKNLLYWAHKWGVSTRQVNEAIIDTGSISVEVLREHFKKNNQLQFPLLSWFRSVSGRIAAARYPG